MDVELKVKDSLLFLYFKAKLYKALDEDLKGTKGFF